ncbi:hypothetical protein DCE93_09180 [Agromyces badenianii]|uniref:Uncharacterized protein n=1 Tax=Agromyces badenianii TaxID=2080742 RepID=A0A2S0WWU7_9MICO|nr:DUF2019 domain-containing protein [Agromyces badenianii]AWB95813.1 hypothetical protein DCE93_09180 [Agromyces badenianii]
MAQDVEELVAQYRDLLVQRSMESARPSVANKLFDRNHAIHKILRESDEGRRAISGLMDDDVDAVRLTAAVHTLQWDPVAAEHVLEDIEAGPGIVGFNAKWALRRYRAGKLNLDW